jgi:hypothetical protein
MRSAYSLALLAAGLSASPAGAALDCSLKAGVTDAEARAGLCGFDLTTRRFKGSAVEQAECLTRRVKPGGAIGGATLTAFLRQRVGETTGVSRDQLSAYVDELGLDSVASLGGLVEASVNADYFIIHDTSTPNCSQPGWSDTLCPRLGELPAARDTGPWAEELGYLGHPKPYPDRLAHAWTNRIGGSITELTFDQPLRSTKFESCLDTPLKEGLFLAIENTQPRVADPETRQPNDRIAPQPGFTPAQYERLALLYVTASVRRGRWLIPAFHAVLDARFRSGHDDPQNFEMRAFSTAVRAHVNQIARQPRPLSR